MRMPARRAAAVAFAAAFAAAVPAPAAPRLAPDWGGREPVFPAGSLYFRTGEFKRSPVLYRAVIEVDRSPLAWAAVRLESEGHVYLFLGGREIARAEARPAEPAALVAELTPHLVPGPNVLVASAAEGGVSIEGTLAYRDGRSAPIAFAPGSLRASKLPPLAVIEDEPALLPSFDASAWVPRPRVGPRAGVPLRRGAARGLRPHRVREAPPRGRGRTLEAPHALGEGVGGRRMENRPASGERRGSRRG